ncbi:4a-hydroxytetrahydrobiopterin dehydratase [Sphaerisporangium album]|uniref:Putative pterin-4-alpha-carbinolamine dehydratase n=1 Tax=Sphaerisporangium album TaxID=509200 RepID=A0A367FI65_9ACTN|nr:4a-hydroxytetrahydrobiopterin dehydratase [Sphaerisporangium album]RCG30021.1 4a-hydroxytetrahydrobiopterin dehydratase [Sphaerisporangium album]
MSLRTPLTSESVTERLGDTGWSGDTAEISRTYAVEYDTAIRIVAEVGVAAIELEHRPDIDIRWDRLRFAMTTHTAGDVVTELDFALAERINEIARRHGAQAVS